MSLNYGLIEFEKSELLNSKSGSKGADNSKFNTQNSKFSIIHLLLKLLDLSVVDVVVVVHQLVDGAAGGKLDDAVGHGLDELVVVT